MNPRSAEFLVLPSSDGIPYFQYFYTLRFETLNNSTAEKRSDRGSGKQAQARIDGLEADVIPVTMLEEKAKKRVWGKEKCWILFILTKHFGASARF
jgi:hypothetical protein